LAEGFGFGSGRCPELVEGGEYFYYEEGGYLLFPCDVAEASVCLSGASEDSDDQKLVWAFATVGMLGIMKLIRQSHFLRVFTG
jgi:hypothetical protein